MKLRIGLYAGSFRPFHLGHLDIAEQAQRVFDSVTIARGINPAKDHIKDDFEFPLKTLMSQDFNVISFNGLLSDQIKTMEDLDYDVTLVRGLRSGADLEYEQNLAAFLNNMKPDIKIVAFYCNPEFRHLSSSALRDIRKFSEEEYEKYVLR